MKIIRPSFEIMNLEHLKGALKRLELIGRTAYKSEQKSRDGSELKFIKTIMNKKHLGVIEHESVTVRIVCDRAIANELVRHRLASYVQESTRYCNYSTDKFNNELTFIYPVFSDERRDFHEDWTRFISFSETIYLNMISKGATPEMARSVLPMSLKTEIVATMNLRQWRHFFMLRTAKTAHPQMREITIPLLKEFRKLIPIIFNTVETE